MNEFQKMNEVENELLDAIVEFNAYPEDRTSRKTKRIQRLLDQVSQKPQVVETNSIEGPVGPQDSSLRAHDLVLVG